MPNWTYLDYNATAPLTKAVLKTIQETGTAWANPASIHQLGKKSASFIEEGRKALAKFIHADPQTITFTATGTEANALVIHKSPLKRIIISTIEHPAVRENAKQSEKIFSTINVDQHGIVNLIHLEKELESSPEPALVCIMLANNETGVIQPIEDIAKIVKKYNGWLHTDAIQALGKIPLNFNLLGVDSMALSGHKIGAAPGVGALVLNPKRTLEPHIWGGGQERGLRSGTVNSLTISSLIPALERANLNLQDTHRQKQLRDDLEKQLKLITPQSMELTIYSEQAPRLTNTSCFSFSDLTRDVALMSFDFEKIALSSGSACSSGTIKPSQALMGMGASLDHAKNMIRVSIGLETTRQDIERFLKTWEKIIEKKKV